MHQPACAVPPFILPSVSSLRLTVHIHVPDHIVCVVSLFVTLIGTRQCKHPILPIRQNAAVMLRDDKPFCGASWRRGVLLPELWRWQRPSLLYEHPQGETLRLQRNSGLTSLSAPEVPRQTHRDLHWHELAHIKDPIHNCRVRWCFLVLFRNRFCRFNTFLSIHNLCCRVKKILLTICWSLRLWIYCFTLKAQWGTFICL